MWDSRTETGDRPKQPTTPGWQSGLEFIKIKVPIKEYLTETAVDHLADNHGDWLEDDLEERGEFVHMDTPECFVYCNVNIRTGEITVVGADNYPLDKTKRFK